MSDPQGWWSLIPVGSVVLGYVGTLATESRKDARTRKLAQEQRDADRKRDRIARREAFALENLQAATAALGDFARGIGKAHFFDSMQARETGRYPSGQLPEGLSDEIFTTHRQAKRHVALILDDATRAACERALDRLNDMATLMNTTEEKADAVMHQASIALGEAFDALGVATRGIYNDI